MPGFGRAPPGRGTGRGIAPASLLVNGLLPGRGAAGRGAAPASLLVNGLLPGRGPAGRGGAASVGAAWAAGASAAAAAAGAAGATGGATAISGSSGATATAAAGASSTDAAVFFAAAFLVVFFAAAFLPSAAPPAGCAGKTSFSLRTTGGSTVDDADLTNSPMSWSLARTTLLSTPSSFASSYTRTFATALLSRGPGSTRRGRGPLVREHAHCCALIACSSPSRPAFAVAASPLLARSSCSSVMLPGAVGPLLCHLLSQDVGVEPARVPERPCQCPPPFGEVETVQGRVQVRAPPVA